MFGLVTKKKLNIFINQSNDNLVNMAKAMTELKEENVKLQKYVTLLVQVNYNSAPSSFEGLKKNIDFIKDEAVKEIF